MNHQERMQSHVKIQAIRDAQHLAILSAMRSFLLQVRSATQVALKMVLVKHRIALMNHLCIQAALKWLTNKTV